MSFIKTQIDDRKLKSILTSMAYGLDRIGHSRSGKGGCKARFNQKCPNHPCSAGCLRCFWVWHLYQLYQFLGYRVPLTDSIAKTFLRTLGTGIGENQKVIEPPEPVMKIEV